MPIKIPLYDAQREPGGFVQSPNAPVAQPPDTPGYIGAALQNLGNAGMGLAGVLRKEQTDDAITKKGRWVSEGQVYWDQQLIDGFNGTTTGRVRNEAGDGDEPLAASISRRFNQWRDQALAQESDPRVRRWLEGQLNTLGTHVNQRAIVLQERATASDRERSMEGTIHNYETQLRTGQIGLEYARGQVMSVIANSGMDPVTRNRYALEVEQRLAQAYGTGQAYRDPRGFRSTIEGYYGGQDSTRTYLDQTQRLFQQESGNQPVPNALGSGAGGRGQWMPQTWAAARAAIPGLPENPNQATVAQEREVNAWFAGNNQRTMTRELGRSATPGELRLAHFVGATGAVALMRQDPNTKFTDLPSDFWQRLGERFSNETFIRQNPGVRNQTVGGLIAQYRQQFEGGAPAPAAPGGQAAAPAAPPSQLPMNADMALMLRTLDNNRLTSFIGFSQNIENRDMARARVDVETTLSNHRSMFMNGQTVTAPLRYEDFDRAYGPLEAGAKWASYQGMMALGADVQNLQNATPSQALAILNRNRPVPNSPDYALQNEKFNRLAEAWNTIQTTRNQDPMADARNRGIASVQDIDYSNQQRFVETVTARIPIATTNRDLYGAGGTSGNLLLFTNPEKQQAQAMFQRMSDQERVGYINALARATENNPAAFQSILQQLFPDRPVYRMAGEISLRQRMVQNTRWFGQDETISAVNVAEIMLRGDTLLHPNATTRAENGTGKTFVMPKDADIERAALDYVGNAFRGRGEAFAEAMQGIRAFYAGWTDRNGTASPEVNSTALQLAIRATVGNVDDHGKGARFVLPWGMQVSAGRAALDRAFAQEMERAGLTGTPQANIRLYDIENYRPNQYVLRVGTDYMKDRNGQTIVLNISGAPGIDGPALPPPPGVGVVPGRRPEIQETFNTLNPSERVAYNKIDMATFRRVAPQGIEPLTVIVVPEGQPYAGRAFIVPTMDGRDMIVRNSTGGADYAQQLYEYWKNDLTPRRMGGRASQLTNPTFPLYNTVDEAWQAHGRLLQVMNDDLARSQASQQPAPQPPQRRPEDSFPAGAPPERGGRVQPNPSGGGRSELRR